MSGEVHTSQKAESINDGAHSQASVLPSTDLPQIIIETTPTTHTPISTPVMPESVNHTHLPSDPHSNDVINNHSDGPDQQLPSPSVVDNSGSVDMSAVVAMEEDASSVVSNGGLAVNNDDPVADSGSPVADSSSPVVDYGGTVVDDPELEEEMERSGPDDSHRDSSEPHLHSGDPLEHQLGGSVHQDKETEKEDVGHTLDTETVPLADGGQTADSSERNNVGSEEEDVEDPEPLADHTGLYDDQHSPEGPNPVPNIPNMEGGDVLTEPLLGPPPALSLELPPTTSDGDNGDGGDDKIVSSAEGDVTKEMVETGEDDGRRASSDMVNGRDSPNADPLEGNGSAPECVQQELENERSHDPHNVDNGGSHDSDGVSHDHNGVSDKENMTSLGPDGLTNGNGAGMLTGQQKEKSVFLRLSNRIRDLEENISLFSSYLDQISTG